MKLLKFPYVVKRHIIKQMNYHEVLWLSFLSHKAFQIIQQLPWKQIKAINFSVFNTDAYICAIGSKKSYLLSIRYGIHNLAGDKFHTLVVSGIRCSTRMHPNGKELILYTHQLQIFEKLRNHIQSLFGTDHFHLDWYQDGEFAKYFCKILGDLQINSSELFHEMETEQLEAFFEGSPNQEHVCIRSSLRGDFKESSEFFTIQNLYMKKAGWVGNDVLRFFKGRSAILENCVMYEIHIIDFLEKWISNTEFNKLDFLMATPVVRFDIDPDWIFSRFLTKKFDPAKKRPVYYYIDKSTNKAHKFSSSHYMVRDCDGTVASIGIQKNRFVFAVWHLNEKQMAETIATL